MLLTVVLLSLAITLGTILGANDAGNLIGLHVSSGAVKYKTASLVAGLSVVIGAVLSGRNGLTTMSALSNAENSFIPLIYVSTIISALIFLRNSLPVSITQTTTGAIVGLGVFFRTVDTVVLLRLVISWFITPVVGFLIGIITYKFIEVLFRRIKKIQVRSLILRVLIWSFIVYGSYSLGANNVGIIVGSLSGKIFNDLVLSLVGGFAIGFGIYKFGNISVRTIGSRIAILDSLSGTSAIMASTLTVFIFANLGTPVSFSHAIIGSIIGCGRASGVRITDVRIVKRITFGWVVSPLIGGLLSFILAYLF